MSPFFPCFAIRSKMWSSRNHELRDNSKQNPQDQTTRRTAKLSMSIRSHHFQKHPSKVYPGHLPTNKRRTALYVRTNIKVGDAELKIRQLMTDEARVPHDHNVQVAALCGRLTIIATSALERFRLLIRVGERIKKELGWTCSLRILALPGPHIRLSLLTLNL